MKTPNFFSTAKTNLRSKKFMFFWFRHYKGMFFLCFVVVLGYGSYSWDFYLNRYQWEAEAKRQFLETNFKETAFKESKFRDIIARLNERDRLHTETLVLTKDIFEGKTLP